MITNYFFPYPQYQKQLQQRMSRYLNITINYVENSNIREQQSTLIEEFSNEYRPHRNTHLNLISSSISLRFQLLLFLVPMISSTIL